MVRFDATRVLLIALAMGPLGCNGLLGIGPEAQLGETGTPPSPDAAARADTGIRDATPMDSMPGNLDATTQDAMSDTGTMPVDGGNPSIDGGTTPIDGGTTPIDGGTTPIDGGTMPMDGGTTPIDGGTTPIDGGTTPIDGGVVPCTLDVSHLDQCLLQ